MPTTTRRRAYSHAGDEGAAPSAFDDFENENLAGRPAYAEVERQLLARLRIEVEKWQTPNPPEPPPSPPGQRREAPAQPAVVEDSSSPLRAAA